MDTFWKVALGIISLPFLLWGISILIQIIGISSMGVLGTFSAVWDKETKLSFKAGLGIGVGYALLSLLIAFLVGWIFGSEALETSLLYYYFRFVYDWASIVLLLIALLRLKFKFAGGFSCILAVICFMTLYAHSWI